MSESSPTGNKTIKDQVLTCKASERQARTDKLWQKISCKTSVHTHTHARTPMLLLIGLATDGARVLMEPLIIEISCALGGCKAS